MESVNASVLLNRGGCVYVPAAAGRLGFDELNKAYNVLSDQQKRERYDEKLPDGIQVFLYI